MKAQVNSSSALRIAVTGEEVACDSNVKYLLAEKIYNVKDLTSIVRL